jgi:hypothetical protein
MAVGLSVTLANSILNHLRGGVAWTAPPGLYVKLHTGDPGAAGTANAAGNTTRQAGTFGAAAAGAMTNTAAIVWTNLPTTETYSHVSVWDAATGGVFQWSGILPTPQAVAANATATFTIQIGQITASFGVAA